MAITRRKFLKGLFQAAAVVAAAKVGLGNLSPETIEAAIAPVEVAETVPNWFGVPFRIDPNCPPNEIWFVGPGVFDESKSITERSQHFARLTNLVG